MGVELVVVSYNWVGHGVELVVVSYNRVGHGGGVSGSIL